MRAMELLSITSNPIDAQILGVPGRAMLLAEVASNLGFDSGKLEAMMEKQATAPQPVPGDDGVPVTPPGTSPPGGSQPALSPEGGQRVAEQFDNKHRVNT